MLDRKSRQIPIHLWIVTLNFFALSLILSWLIGMGQHSYRIPLLVAATVFLALVNTDWLGWFRLNKYVAYVAMMCGAGVAIYEFFYGRDREVEKLFSVANLLVYVQLPIMFQKKDQRLFDHWGIFLVLEIVVAALLNDNLLFGILLIPVLVVACSTLISLAAFTSIQQGGTSGAESAGWLPRLLRWLGQEQTRTRRTSGIKMLGIKARSEVPVHDFQLGWGKGLPFGMIIVMFALIYFFALPRLQTGAYEGLGKSKALVGFSGTISLDNIGELMSNRDIALRISMTNVGSNRSYQPTEPPYVRGLVVQSYDGGGNWHSLDPAGIPNDKSERKLLNPRDVRPDLIELSEHVVVSITEHASVGQTEFSIPPFYYSEPTSTLRFIPRDWRLFDPDRNNSQKKSKRRYSFETFAFHQGKQSPFLLDAFDSLSQDKIDGLESMVGRPSERLTKIDRKKFPMLISLSEKILKEKTNASHLEKALMIEEHLANSPDFTYSLLPAFDRTSNVDPIEDFAGRHRTGHCQFFASTLAMMLRSQNIPSRIVLGFRPPEYNDIGRFFVVRQNHAHAWVEAWIAKEELRASTMSIPSWVSEGAWVRLDPTPPGENSNAGGSLKKSQSQTFEAAEQFWQEYVMKMDGKRQSEAIGMFGATGNGSVGVLLRSIERMMLQLQTKNLDSTDLQTNRWFSWKSGGLAIATVLGFALIMRYRKRWHNFSGWNWPQIGKWGAKSGNSSVPLFFKRFTAALGKLGLKRAPSQTPMEFAAMAEKWLKEHDFQSYNSSSNPILSLPDITETFYQVRYGFRPSVTQEELDSIHKSILCVERFILLRRK